VRSQGRSSIGHTVIMTEGHEIVDFKLQFQHWPKNVVQKLYEAGREKVAGVRTIVVSCLLVTCLTLTVNTIARSNAESWCSNFQASGV
jgi:hypothetical protein